MLGLSVPLSMRRNWKLQVGARRVGLLDALAAGLNAQEPYVGKRFVGAAGSQFGPRRAPGM